MVQHNLWTSNSTPSYLLGVTHGPSAFFGSSRSSGEHVVFDAKGENKVKQNRVK